jgi:hypothetical protein
MRGMFDGRGGAPVCYGAAGTVCFSPPAVLST